MSNVQRIIINPTSSEPTILHIGGQKGAPGDVHGSRAINTTGGLQGGGDLTADRELSIADNGVTTEKVAPAAISTSRLENHSVTTEKLAVGVIDGFAEYGGSIVTFLSSGTFEKADYPDAVAFKFIVKGGGGAGGGANAATSGQHSKGSGGGEGESVVATLAPNDLGDTVAVTIGTGGAGASAANGGDGGDTSVGSLIVAKGGSGGSYQGTSAAIYGASGGSGGSGGTVPSNGYSIAGVIGGVSLGGPGLCCSGSGGGTGGGRGVFTTSYSQNLAGNNALANSGGGGSGAAVSAGGAARAGGNGGSGVVIVEVITNRLMIAESAEIADGDITTAKINNGAVTTEKLADSGVTSAKIANGTIVDEDVNASAAIAQSKIDGLVTSLAGKASTSHTHAQSDVTGLVTALAGKASVIPMPAVGRHVPNGGYAGTTTLLTAGNQYYWPVHFDHEMTTDEITLRVISNTGSATFKIGLYAPGLNGAQLWATDLQTPGASNSWHVITPSPPVNIPTRAWLGVYVHEGSLAFAGTAAPADIFMSRGTAIAAVVRAGLSDISPLGQTSTNAGVTLAPLLSFRRSA